MKLIVFLADEQLAVIQRVQGPDFDLQRLTQSYLIAKVEQDRQMLETLEASHGAPSDCAWDNTGDPDFDGCTGCVQSCNYRPVLCRTEDLAKKSTAQ